MDSHQVHNHEEDGHKQAPIIVMMVPFPAQSHLNQLLRLSCLISSHNIPVHYAGSTIHNRQVKLRAHEMDSLNIERIHFHDFPLPPFLSPSPNPQSSTKFPAHIHPLFEASSHLRQPFTALLNELSSTTKANRIVIIHDTLMASVVQDSAFILNAETYAFHGVSAFTSFFDLWESLGKPFQIEAEVVPNELPSLEGCLTFQAMNFIAHQIEFLNFRAGDLINTSRSMEHIYIDLLEKIHGNKKHWSIGPLNPVTICKQGNSNSQDKCLSWLDKQAPKSVIYISFGTTTSMTDEQIKELANSLEQSKTKFIWVLRDADKGDIFTQDCRRSIELPEGFEKRMEELGMIVRDWAPQLEILGHPSTGGFMSHCGWNSCMESLSMGVPIAAWPMHSDQPKNAVLISGVLKVGVIVKKWAHKEEIVESSHIKEAVRRLMASEEGDQMRKRADALRKHFKQSVGKDGVSCLELESFIAHVTR
ncbi:hypothetical protein JRO89_XS11G0086600 [Xanthoceras sorbifolium]|uniref:Glycosyltransferase n=1 Tax=Xanthoceras sorbifolium TaxID=99658 RepID=A0ABQ8HF48_9ROSI|nr:hypothetical protein JRO89_XS11G0086600 [Xanthoceras sorbifolium]